MNPELQKRILYLITRYRVNSALHRENAPFVRDIAAKHSDLARAEIYTVVVEDLEALLRDYAGKGEVA